MNEENGQEKVVGEVKRGRKTKTALNVQVTWDMIAERAYHISLSPEAGSDLDNWLRAEEELLGRFLVRPASKPRAKKTAPKTS